MRAGCNLTSGSGSSNVPTRSATQCLFVWRLLPAQNAQIGFVNMFERLWLLYLQKLLILCKHSGCSFRWRPDL